MIRVAVLFPVVKNIRSLGWVVLRTFEEVISLSNTYSMNDVREKTFGARSY